MIKARVSLLPLVVVVVVVVGLSLLCSAFQSPPSRPDVYSRERVQLWARRKRIIAGDEYKDYFQKMNWNGEEEEGPEGNAWQGGGNKAGSSRSGPKMDEEEQAYYERINAYQGADKAQPDLPLSAVTSRVDKPVSSTGAGRFLQYSLSENAKRPHFRLTGAYESSSSSSSSTELGSSAAATRKKLMQSLSPSEREALEAAASSKTLGPTCTTSYTVELTRLAQERKPEMALALYEQMRRDGVSPSSATYAAVLRACNTAGNLDMALKVLQEMIAFELSEENRGTGVYVGGLNWAASLLCRSRQYQLLVDTLMQLHKSEVELRPSTFNLLLGALGEEGRFEEILRVFAMMKDYGVYADEQSYSCAITALVAQGNITEATTLLTEMSDKGLAARPEAVKTWFDSAGGVWGSALPNIAL